MQEMQEAAGTEAVDRTEETDGKKPALETGDGEEGLTVISKTDNEEGEVIWENGNEEREATSETGNEKGAAGRKSRQVIMRSGCSRRGIWMIISCFVCL